jgi:hypothetical protein
MPSHPKPLPAQQAGSTQPVSQSAPSAPPRSNHTGTAVASLVLAIVAPVSLLFTASFASFAMLLTFPYDGPSRHPWLAPLVFWSMPLIFGSISVALGARSLRKSRHHGEDSGLAIASLCISAVIFVIGLIFTLRFVHMMR